MLEFFLILLAIGSIVVLPNLIHQAAKEQEQREQAVRSVRKGMSSIAVIEILGEAYTTSNLKDKSVKLEWKFSAGPVVKVSVYFRNNTAYAISSTNMDTSLFYENEIKEPEHNVRKERS